jgi:hypothetical protein
MVVMRTITASEAWEHFGEAFYLNIMDGFPYDSTDDYQRIDALEEEMRRVAPQVTDLVVQAMWNAGWREALMASWWAGICGFPKLGVSVQVFP